jgi:hypothetical protein
MKSRSIVKTGAVTASAVALLVMSALFTPSTALGSIGGKLYSTIEPGASCQYQMSVSTYGGTVTVSCKGLTPGGTYWLEVKAWVRIPSYGEYFPVSSYASAVASKTGSAKLGASVSITGYYGAYISGVQFSVVNAAGTAVLMEP